MGMMGEYGSQKVNPKKLSTKSPMQDASMHNILLDKIEFKKTIYLNCQQFKIYFLVPYQ